MSEQSSINFIKPMADIERSGSISPDLSFQPCEIGEAKEMKAPQVMTPVQGNCIFDNVNQLNIVGLLERASGAPYIFGRVRGHEEVAEYIEREAARLFVGGEEEIARRFLTFRDSILAAAASIRSTHDEYDGPRRDDAYLEAGRRDFHISQVGAQAK